jgi:WD40 repeat protein
MRRLLESLKYHWKIKKLPLCWAFRLCGVKVPKCLQWIIGADYDITEIDSLEHDTSNGAYNSLVKIDSTHFILAYTGIDYDGYIKTFSIDGSYNITEIDSLEHDTGNGQYNSLVQIDSTHFILAYRGPDDDAFVKTFEIDESYEITELQILEHDTSDGTYNSLVKIDSTHFILAYNGNENDGYVKTFSVVIPVPTTRRRAAFMKFF